MTDEQTVALAAYDAACRRLRECIPDDKSAEQKFGLTYRRMVELGMAMPLKRKYGGR